MKKEICKLLQNEIHKKQFVENRKDFKIYFSHEKLINLKWNGLSMNIQDIYTIFGIVNTIYSHRSKLHNLLQRTRIGKTIVGIVMLPYLIYAFYKIYKDPEMIRLIARANSQKKILDYC